MKNNTIYSLLVLLSILNSGICLANPISSSDTLDEKTHGVIDYGIQGDALTANEGNWKGSYVRGSWKQNEQNIWNYEVVSAQRFHDHGIYYDGGITHTFNDRWYGALTLARSTNGSFWSHYRSDAFLHYKLLQEKNMILNLGLTNDKAEDAHRDQMLHLGITYYFKKPWIIESEWTSNNSKPGNVRANYSSLAVSYGKSKESIITLRYASGKEAYQLIDDSQEISSFYSHAISIRYRKWLDDDFGIELYGEHYKNYIYERNGVDLGMFKEF